MYSEMLCENIAQIDLCKSRCIEETTPNVVTIRRLWLPCSSTGHHLRLFGGACRENAGALLPRLCACGTATPAINEGYMTVWA